ncbi:UDP-Gal:beta c beta 1,4- galactosyltransferase, polypeptide 1, gene 1 isoform X1 [Pelobates cultripes]|uniref:UDP-Gal:beta c beta 1,4- galactosyltransferase, polypeptide 1, gene 1 isoform X1 n=1 Tax=Pelobates cultripes TaxID=61616 RepID=A0AAD1W303_PELCU|nr:UDP-Gal:beta c beta 1,4- galactosyltransferase, polypeptide 1, gene 1 isoform X1 [Pelobates cultripes]
MKRTWRLNDTLLTEVSLRDQITQTLTNDFTENEMDDVSDMTVWEAHKSVIRGKLIQLASQRKKEAGRLMSELIDQINTPETQHKRSQVEDTYKELLEARRQLHTLLLQRHLRQLRRSKGFFYLHANKGGKLLAHMLKGQQQPAQVHKLKLQGVTTTQHLERIANEFLNYYSSLYDTHKQGDEHERTKRDRIEHFI